MYYETQRERDDRRVTLLVLCIVSAGATLAGALGIYGAFETFNAGLLYIGGGFVLIGGMLGLMAALHTNF